MCLVLPNCWEHVAIFVGACIQGIIVTSTNADFTECKILESLIKYKVSQPNIKDFERVYLDKENDF